MLFWGGSNTQTDGKMMSGIHWINYFAFLVLKTEKSKEWEKNTNLSARWLNAIGVWLSCFLKIVSFSGRKNKNAFLSEKNKKKITDFGWIWIFAVILIMCIFILQEESKMQFLGG